MECDITMTMKKSKKPDIDELSFEQAIGKLEEIVEKIETGQTGLEEAISQYELGCKLIQRCKSILNEAERKIEILNKDISGQLKPEPLSEELESEIDEAE